MKDCSSLLFFLIVFSTVIGVLSFRPSRTHKLRLSDALTIKSSYKDGLISEVKQNFVAGSVVVIKYGGHAMENPELSKYFCEDVADLSRIGVLPVIIHGGGPQIAKTLKSLAIESVFVQGLRVTDQKTMEVAQMVLCGSINKDIVGTISSYKGLSTSF